MLYLRPELVRTDKMEGTNLDEPHDHALDDMFKGGALGVYRPFEEYSESGAIGDPSLASTKIGETIYTHLGDELEELLLDVHDQLR